MNRGVVFLSVLSALSLVLAAPPAAQAYDYSYARVVRLSLVDGDVQVARPDTQGWEPAIVNLPIQQGFSIATGRGRAEIEFESGATARLAENSLLQFTELALSGGARLTKLTLTQGTATFYANLSREDSFVVATPQLQVGIPENARFRVDVSDDGSSVSMLKGEVDVDSRAGTNRLTKGHTLVYRTSDPDRVTLERNPKANEWDRWVAERDEVVHTGSTASLRYVNSPYSYGLADLYRYGNWFSFGGYGLGWRPFGVGLNWAPFWDGRWAFYPGLGWTWISFEPWGWMPYHFGRWVFSPAFGWVWVPSHFNTWQPACVAWVRVRNRLGWVPLAPQDRPGQTPTNLQHGVVTASTGFIGADPDAINGFIGAKRFERRLVTAGDNPEVVPAPPMRAGGNLPPAQGGIRGGTTPPARVAGDTREQRGIVYDPRERKFVNQPMVPVRIGDKVGDARAETEAAPARRGSSAVAPRPAPTQTPAERGGSIGRPTPSAPPARTGERDVGVRPVPSPPPAPRMERPRPDASPRVERPPARVESSRPAPPPRMESPRASSPPPAPRSRPGRPQ